jgi:hypothetical protein
MSSLIKLKKSSVPGKVPLVEDLAYGELALNFADGKLYYRSADNQVLSFNVSPDHASLMGLLADDHPQYVHIDVVRTITASHQFDPVEPAPPFTLGPNAQGQLVLGLNADQLGGNPASFYYSPANRPVLFERYTFNNALQWIIVHNKNTTQFSETLTDISGNRFFAKTHIIDENSFRIDLTSALSGTVDVMFVM